ncbi:MAG: dihydroxyacetone kinase subunit DhaL [Candidatus Humimicrobiaceae bacterium]
MENNLFLEDFKKIINGINKAIQENKILLCKLDSVIGDGDHGMTIAKGFDAAMEKIEKTQPANISDLLKTTGNAIIASIGGVAGPIFGSLFSELGRTISSDTESVDIKVLSSMFSASLTKIMKLGGAEPGNKTMIDAFYPAVKILEDSAAHDISIKEALSRMVKAAKTGAESTKDMISSKGRSSYAGERSLGYEDAGANTVYFIIKAIYEELE